MLACVTALRETSRLACIKTVGLMHRRSAALLFALGVCLLLGGLHGLSAAQINPPETAEERMPDRLNETFPRQAANFFPLRTPTLPVQQANAAPPQNLDAPYDDTLVRNATGNLFRYIEGAFGALVMTAAGIGAIIAAALGNYKLGVALIVVAVGAFILRAFVSLFFGTNYPAYDVNGIEQVGNI